MNLAQTALDPLPSAVKIPAIATPAGRSGWVTCGYYLTALLPVVFYLLLGHNQFLNPDAGRNWVRWFAVVQFLIMLVPVISSFIYVVIGMLFFGAPRDRRPGADWQWDQAVHLLVTYVSRGNESGTLLRATSETRRVLDLLGVNYTIEVVTDIEIPSENKLVKTAGAVLYFVVPPDYETLSGARYKARALQYLLEQRTLRLAGREDADNVWILHMDEESIASPECLLGIREHIEKYDLRRTPGAIGQGEILYNAHRYGDHSVITAIDASRTGGDLGLFRLQYKAMHIPWVGMHGSFVLTPARIEREITWDMGAQGSILEDSYFALVAMERGVRFDWVEGFIREQSPLTIPDVIRQRRRWYCGLAALSRNPLIKLRARIGLRIVVLFCTIAALCLPLPLLYIQQRLMFGNGLLPYWTFLMAAGSTGLYAAACSVGLYRNLLHCQTTGRRKCWLILVTAVSWFFYVPALVECAGVLYGVFFPVSSFYVVAKDDQS